MWPGCSREATASPIVVLQITLLNTNYHVTTVAQINIKFAFCYH